MDPYNLHSCDLPVTRPDPVQDVHTYEGTTKSDVDVELLCRASSGLIALAISSSVARPEVETSGEKTRQEPPVLLCT